MPAPNINQKIEAIPVNIVGGSNFGRYPKVNSSQTWNMIVSDNFLVPYAGYKSVITTSSQAPGRGIHTSTRGNFMIAVVGDVVYKISTSLVATQLSTLSTTSGDVYISENNNSQICITDGSYVYVYNYSATPPGNFIRLTSGFGGQFPYQNPGYISFQNGRLIIASLHTSVWVMSAINDATDWTSSAAYQGALESKPDYVQAALPIPGAGNNLFLFGSTVAEQWQDVGAALFPYQRASTFNVDYGCLNASSIAYLNNYVVWLAINEQSGPVIMVATGNNVKAITTDGIDFKLGNLTDPTNCTAFLFQQDGHLIYQFTFITDNLSYAYDFESSLFFNISDPDLNYHPAREVVYFNNQYFFVSLNGGNIYLFDTNLSHATYADGSQDEIPRIRITPPLRRPDQRYFIVKSLGFTVENGEPNKFTSRISQQLQLGISLATEGGKDLTTENGVIIDTQLNIAPTTISTISSQRVDLSISRDGGENFGSSYGLDMNPTGKRKSRFIFQRLGQANDITFQLRFHGLERFLVTEGICETYT